MIFNSKILLFFVILLILFFVFRYIKSSPLFVSKIHENSIAIRKKQLKEKHNEKNLYIELYFGDDYDIALKNAKKYYPQIKNIAKEFETDQQIILSIIFPELIRYSLFKDIIETSAVEFIYIKNGIKATDFSIGLFQIRTSFVEKMELYVSENPELQEKCDFILLSDELSSKEKRKTRVKRLKTISWQIKYVNCFYHIAYYKFPNLKNKNKSEQIFFIAAAYNYGFNCSEKEISEWSKVNAFPNGSDFSFKQYSYSFIALNFYQNYLLNSNF